MAWNADEKGNYVPKGVEVDNEMVDISPVDFSYNGREQGPSVKLIDKDLSYIYNIINVLFINYIFYFTWYIIIKNFI